MPQLTSQIARLSRRLKIKDDVKSLVDNLKELKMTEGEVKVEQLPDRMTDDNVIQLARSVKEIKKQVVVFQHLKDRKEISCVMCDESFDYKEEETDFNGKLMGHRFSKLKFSLRKHLKSGNHIMMIQKEEKEAHVEKKEEARNRKVGGTIGGLVYDTIFNGRPDDDLPRLIYRVKMAGGDVGDLNHSKNLVPKLLPEISGVVEGRLKKFLSSNMVATGSLPPVNIMADKATDKR